jgi:DNA-binding NtrC family response regulator
VVDDNEDWRAVVAEILSDAGFAVTTASDGRAACDCLRRAKQDVVVTDFQMPLMNGCQLLAALRCIDGRLPVIIVTGEDDPVDASIFAGAFRVIKKPPTTEAVVSAVTEALRCHRAPRLRALWSAARDVAQGARHRGHAALARTVNRDRRPRDRRRLALVAGFGIATAAAVLIAAIRSQVA